jgi:hypothetical protein
LQRLRAELREIRASIEAAHPGPRWVEISGDPNGMGEDDGEVVGVSYHRQADENLDQFRDRLASIAHEAGAPFYFTGVGRSRLGERAMALVET